MLSIEQMVRNLLEAALKDGLVAASENYEDPDPQIRTAGELCGVANLLNQYFADAVKQCNDRWQLAKGHGIETAERLAAAEEGR